MTALEHALRHAAAELGRCQVPFALVGGLAVAVRAEPRLTRDADDLKALAGVAAPEDWTAAVAASHLITERGYSRGRDLPELLARLRARGAF